MNSSQTEDLHKAILTLLPAGLDLGVVGESQVVGGIPKGSAGRGDGVEDVTSLQVDLDSVCLQEALHPAGDQSLHVLGLGVVLGEGTGSAIADRGSGGLHNCHALGQTEGVLAAENLEEDSELAT